MDQGREKTMMEPVTKITGEQRVSLGDIDPASTGGVSKEMADARFEELRQELRELHDLMMAAETHALLLVLEGMDAAGKDVTIENVHGAFNPQMARVTSFSAPVGEETQHHFLWRADLALPAFGEVGTFDRAYHEEALPKDLEGDVSGDALERRYGHIANFERLLTDEGTIVVKVFLHIGKETQRKRLEERQEDIQMAWKISDSDWLKRDKWDEYMQGFEDMMNGTATPEAPWYVVPAEHRWYHNPAVAQILVDRMRPHREAWEQKRREIGEQNREEARKARQEAGD